MKILILMVILGACTTELTGETEQDIEPTCNPVSDPNCPSDGGGGPGPIGGNGDGSGVPRSCSITATCDPLGGFASDLSCMQMCANTSARCYFDYRCGRNPSNECTHLGHCG